MVSLFVRVPGLKFRGSKSISYFDFPARCTVGYAISYIEAKLNRALALRRKNKVFGSDSFSKLNESIKVLKDKVWDAEYVDSRPMLMVHAPHSLRVNRGLACGCHGRPQSQPDLTAFVIMHVLRLTAYQATSSVDTLKQHLVDLTVSWGTSSCVRGPGGLEFKWHKRSIRTMRYWNWYVGGLIGVREKDITMDVAIKNIEAYIEDRLY